MSISRAFVVDRELYGNVKRNALGLTSFAPVLQLDDTSHRAYFGKNAVTAVVDAQTQQTLAGDHVQLPLDVKATGALYLTQMGMEPAEQELLLAKWLLANKEQRDALTAAWAALDLSNMEAVTQFIQGVIATLQSL